jgi:hypothetical protein
VNTSFSSPDDYFAGINLDSAPKWGTAEDLSQISVAAFRSQHSISTHSQSRAFVRLHGPAVQNNAIPVRKTLRVLGSLQDAISAVGAALHGDPPGLRGRLPEFPRAATDLLLVAQPTPGSVVLTLQANEPEQAKNSPEPALLRVQTLADQSMHRILEILRLADKADFDQSLLLDDLRPLGPRVARQLVKLAEAILDDEVLVDLSWQEPGRELDTAVLRRSTALMIRDTITNARVDVDQVTLTGILQTVSQIRPLDLRLDSGELITLEATEDARKDVGRLYGRRIEIIAEMTVKSSGTGPDRARYQLISVRAVD